MTKRIAIGWEAYNRHQYGLRNGKGAVEGMYVDDQRALKTRAVDFRMVAVAAGQQTAAAAAAAAMGRQVG